MPLARYLVPGEEVVSQYRQFYATSIRIIHYQRKENGREEIRSLPYSSLETVELVTRPRHLIMVLGTAIAIAALPLFFYLPLSSILLLLVGIGLVIYGGIEREAYYQLHARNMTGEEARLWRIPRRGGGQIAATVRYMIGDKLNP